MNNMSEFVFDNNLSHNKKRKSLAANLGNEGLSLPNPGNEGLSLPKSRK